jgi:molybdopterin converting factor small subunit
LVRDEPSTDSETPSTRHKVGCRLGDNPTKYDLSGVKTMPRVIIPSPLRRHADNKREVRIDGSNIQETMDRLSKQYPGLDAILKDSAMLSVFVNNKLVKSAKDGEASMALDKDDEVTLMIPLAGG